MTSTKTISEWKLYKNLTPLDDFVQFLNISLLSRMVRRRGPIPEFWFDCVVSISRQYRFKCQHPQHCHMANVVNIFKIVNIAFDIQRREIAQKSAKGTRMHEGSLTV